MAEVQVTIAIGSISDAPYMTECCKILEELNITYDKVIISAHRTPERIILLNKKIQNNEYKTKIIIAGAGGAAHLPGMLAAFISLPVIGVPMPSSCLQGVDSVLSILQMPFGTPVATMAIGKSGAKNAAIFAGLMLGISNSLIKEKTKKLRTKQKNQVPYTFT